MGKNLYRRALFCIIRIIRHTKLQNYLQFCKFFRTFVLKILFFMTQHEFKQLQKLHLKKYRDEFSLFVAEGDKCIGELSAAFEVVHLLTPADTPLRDIQRLSSLRTPQGSLAVLRKPDYGACPLPQPGTLYLALDEVQDPGNLGTIIRTADWFGIRHIVCSRNTADCFSPKVVQATMGSLARVRVYYTDLTAWLSSVRAASPSLPVYGTLLDGADLYSPHALPDRRSGVIVMGNEGNGLSPEVRRLLTCSLRIPSFPPDVPTCESLNVAIATAIILAEFRRV